VKFNALNDVIFRVKMSVTGLVFEPIKLKDVFTRLCCCYGNLLRPKTTMVCLPMTGHLLDLIIIASAKKEW